MAEYIKRADAMKICQGYSRHCFETNDAKGQDIAERIEDDIVEMPTADVVEVKHGKWIEWWDDNYLSFFHKCSECGGYPLTKEETMHDEVLSAFCPNCGAKMDGKVDKHPYVPDDYSFEVGV